MKIYTKQGDTGKTQVYAKEILKLDKDDALLECYGTLDELNAWMGVLHSKIIQDTSSNSVLLHDKAEQVQRIQQELFAIGFAISDQASLNQDMIDALETAIDTMQAHLSPQTKFILPGGDPLAADIHVARTVARRAERRIVSLAKVHNVHPLAMSFINRLSDYLFVLARLVNKAHAVADIEV